VACGRRQPTVAPHSRRTGRGLTTSPTHCRTSLSTDWAWPDDVANPLSHLTLVTSLDLSANELTHVGCDVMASLRSLSELVVADNLVARLDDLSLENTSSPWRDVKRQTSRYTTPRGSGSIDSVTHRPAVHNVSEEDWPLPHVTCIKSGIFELRTSKNASSRRHINAVLCVCHSHLGPRSVVPDN